MSQAVSLTALRERIGQIERPARHGVLPFGIAAIDRALPGGGLALGAVHEILGQGGDEEDASAATGFAAGILARLGPHPTPTSPSHRFALGPSLSALQGGEGKPGRRSNSLSAPTNGRIGGGEGRGEVGDARALSFGPVLWCLKRPDLYGPGLAAHGLDPARLVIVVAPRDDEILWAIEEGLRLPGLAAVVGEVGRLPMVAGRRLQLAAERSGVTALLLRRWRDGGEAAAERERPSAALTRWRVTALPARDIAGVPGIGKPRRRVELLRCRGGAPAAWDVEVADASGDVSVSAGLADRPAPPLPRNAEPQVRHFG
jgi:protein ImuA